MARVKYDVSKAEKRNFEVPKPGVYEAVIREMSHGDSNSGNPMLTIVFEITKGEHKGSRVWYYILTDGSQEWRHREFTDALGLPTKGTLDTDELVGMVVKIKTAVDPARDGYDEKAKIKNVLPGKDSKSSGAEEEDGDEPPYEEWEIADLKEEAEARELKIAGRQTKKKLVDALNADDEENDGEDEEEEGEEDEEDEEDGLTRKELDGMSRAELKKLIAEEELEIKVLKKHSDDDLREKIAEALELDEDEEEGEGDEDEDEGEEDEDTDYKSWEISELKAELKERGLKTDGRKSSLVARLEKDDASDDEPF